MPVINGEKYACSSCIKGHRVSGCTHTDRELHHINPKGRPVKQCEHCRGARKSKSHHAKCDCGDKKEKNKDKSDAKGEMIADIGVDEVSNRAVVDANSCRCHSGARCICGMRTDSLDLKLDTGRQSLHDARAKPKLTSTHSESVLTVFANGHHKPCHRNNNTAHVSGAPYKIPRPHTLHGSAAFASYSQDNLLGGYGRPEAPAQRSMDTLSLSNNDFYAMFGSPSRSDGLPITPLTGAAVQESLFNSQGSNLFGQDSNSPSENVNDTTSTQKWPWTNSVALSGNFGLGSLSTSPSQDCLPNLQNDWSIPSAGLDNPLWSAGDLPLDPKKLSDNITQPISHSGDSNKHSVPPLTTASSAQSEIGEGVFGDLDFRNPPSAVSETLFWEDTPTFRLATTSATSDIRPAPISMPSATPGDRGSLDLDFLERMSKTSPFEPDVNYSPNSVAFSDEVQPPKNVNGVPQTMTATSPSDTSTPFTNAEFSEPRAITIPNNIDDVVSNDPWALDQNTTAFSGLAGFDSINYSNWL